MLSEAHAISLHVPLNSKTRHLLNAEAFARMRPGAFVVNTSRGELIDQAALIDAIESDHIVGAALDVFETEPLDEHSRLPDLPQVSLTPHTAFFSDDSILALQRLAADEGERALSEKPLRSPVC